MSLADPISSQEDDKRRHMRPRPSRHELSQRRPSVTPLSSNKPASPTASTDENDAFQSSLYDNLATFTFGDARSNPTPASSSYRPPAQISNSHNLSQIAPFDVEPEDVEELVRGERAKMRAIDDGTRRPSLPSNLHPDLLERRPSQPINVPRPSNQQPQDTHHHRTDETLSSNPNSLEISPLSTWPQSSRDNTPSDAHDSEVDALEILPDTPPPDSQRHEDTVDNSALAGFDLNFIMGGNSMGGSSSNLDRQNSISSSTTTPRAQAHSHGHSFLFPFTSQSSSARRPSTASALSDGQNDTFFRHINKNDVEYTTRRKQWSFRRRDAVRGSSGRPSGAGGSTTGKDREKEKTSAQLWECFTVGKFSVSRCRSTKEEPSDKPQPQRLLIRPYHPPAPTLSPSSPTQRHHPTALIHKHSRANAFSIFRASKLRTTHMSASQCVLLAPLKVQVHYTETRSTRALKTYDFLEDRSGSRSTSIDRMEGFSSPSRPPLNILTATPSSSSGSRTITNRIGNSHPVVSPGSRMQSISPQARSPVSPLDEEDDDIASLNETRERVRRSHADAFTVLDERQLEAHRATVNQMYLGHEPVPVPIEVARVRQSRFGTALKRAFAVTPAPPLLSSSVNVVGQSGHGSSDRNGYYPPGSERDRLDANGIYVPPWITLPPRSQQEKNERTLHQLNKSFEDVGLLPHRKKPSHGSASTAGPTSSLLRRAFGGHVANGDAFEEVPEDSPVMLLPMWASDNGLDVKGKVNSFNSINIPLPERRYLLIYYVPFAAGSSSKVSGKGDRKRARIPHATLSETERASIERDRDRDAMLSAFRVVAKVLSYEDVRRSGLRLPNEGIEISPSTSNSSPASPNFSSTPLPLSNFGDTMVIAICPSPESGIEFVPEGLDKLGLCYRPTDVPISSLADPAECERLSPVGRAIVEMAWCGCLCVMGLASTL